MQVVIDIDDDLYTRLFDNGVDNYDDELAKAIRKGTPISDNATNGDIVKALLNVESIGSKSSTGSRVISDLGGDLYMRVSDKWWNAPYKGGNDGLQNKD